MRLLWELWLRVHKLASWPGVMLALCGTMVLLTHSCAARERLFGPGAESPVEPGVEQQDKDKTLELPVIPPADRSAEQTPGNSGCIPYISCEFASGQVMTNLTALQQKCMSECEALNAEAAAQQYSLSQLLQEKCQAPCGPGYNCSGPARFDCGAQCQVPLTRCGYAAPGGGGTEVGGETTKQDDTAAPSQHSFFTAKPLCQEGTGQVPANMMNRLCLKRTLKVRFDKKNARSGYSVISFPVSGVRDLSTKYLNIRTQIKSTFISWQVRSPRPAWLPDEYIKFQLPHLAQCRHPKSCKGEVMSIPSGRLYGRGNFQEHVGIKIGIFPDSAALEGRCVFKMQLFDKRFDTTLPTATSQDALAELVGSC